MALEQPKAGCKTLNEQQLDYILDYYKNKNFKSNEERAFYQGFAAGICFLGVDEWEKEYGQTLEEFLDKSYKLFEAK